MPRPWQGANSPTRRQAARAVIGWRRRARTRGGEEGEGGGQQRRGRGGGGGKTSRVASETNGMTRRARMTHRARDTVDASRAQSRSTCLVLPSCHHPRARYAPPPLSIARLAPTHSLWTDNPGNMLPVLFVLTRRRSTRRVGGLASLRVPRVLASYSRRKRIRPPVLSFSFGPPSMRAARPTR